MRYADILLSVLVHAGLVAGVMYGLSPDANSETCEILTEPIFFEILEETAIESDSGEEISEGSVPSKVPAKAHPDSVDNEGPVPTIEGSVPAAAAISLSMLEAHPPSIVHGADPVEEGPLPLPPPSKMPVDNEGPVPANEGSVPAAAQEQARVVSEPRALNKIVPVYPRSARRRGREGVVTLEISVSDSGYVSDAAVVGGSGYGDLDSAAISAVRTAKFAPATEDGVQVEGRLRLTFEFRLK